MDHHPVLLKESIEGLRVKPDGVYIDGTLGRGGHTLEIIKRLNTGIVVAIDRDADAIYQSRKLLSGYQRNVRFVHGNFKDLAEIMVCEEIDKVDGMIFDFGLSSPQIDDGERGFSYMKDAPLDMRMDKRNSLSAFEVVNQWPADELRRIFRDYGEERYAGLIARAIAVKRDKANIHTTFDLNEIIISAIPAAARREAQHPAKRCYQAIRIAVNDEIGSISAMLDIAPDLLNTGGRICVISFHSLEDRLTKNTFAIRTRGCICPKDFPV